MKSLKTILSLLLMLSILMQSIAGENFIGRTNSIEKKSYGEEIKEEKSQHLAPYSTLVLPAPTYIDRDTLLNKLNKHIKNLCKIVLRIGTWGTVMWSSIYYIATFMKPELYPTEQWTFAKLGLILASSFLLVKLLIHFNKNNFKKPLAFFIFFMITLTSAYTVTDLKDFVPVSEIRERYEENSKNLTPQQTKTFTRSLWDPESKSYVFGFQNEENLANFINHNELLWLTVNNHYFKDGSSPNDPQGLLRAKFLRVAWEAQKSAFPLHTLTNRPLSPEEKHVLNKTLFIYTLYHGSLLRMNVLETPLRDKVGQRPGIGHLGGEGSLKILKRAKALAKWSQNKDPHTPFPVEIINSERGPFYVKIQQNQPDDLVRWHQVWQNFSTSHPTNSPTFSLQELEAKILPSDVISVPFTTLGRFNPSLQPEFIDSWAFTPNFYRENNLDENLLNEGAFWAIRARLLNIYTYSALHWSSLLNHPDYQHLTPQYLLHFGISYQTHGIKTQIENGVSPSDLILSPEQIKKGMKLPEGHLEYFFDQLFHGEGPLFSEYEKSLIFHPQREKPNHGTRFEHQKVQGSL